MSSVLQTFCAEWNPLQWACGSFSWPAWKPMGSRRQCPSNGWSHGNRGMWCVARGKFQPWFHRCPVPAHYRYADTLASVWKYLHASHTLLFQRRLSRLYFLYSLYTLPSLFYLVAGEIVEEPDIHLILEYPSGASWGHYTSRRANRYVAVNWQNTYILWFC